jgi:hypothetical protein
MIHPQAVTYMSRVDRSCWETGHWKRLYPDIHDLWKLLHQGNSAHSSPLWASLVSLQRTRHHACISTCIWYLLYISICIFYLHTYISICSIMKLINTINLMRIEKSPYTQLTKPEWYNLKIKITCFFALKVFRTPHLVSFLTLIS